MKYENSLRDQRANIRGESLEKSPQGKFRQSHHSHARPTLPKNSLDKNSKTQSQCALRSYYLHTGANADILTISS